MRANLLISLDYYFPEDEARGKKALQGRIKPAGVTGFFHYFKLSSIHVFVRSLLILLINAHNQMCPPPGTLDTRANSVIPFWNTIVARVI